MASLYQDDQKNIKTGVLMSRVIACAVLMRAGIDEIKAIASRLQGDSLVLGFTWTPGNYLFNGVRMAEGAIRSFEAIRNDIQGGRFYPVRHWGDSHLAIQERVLTWLTEVEDQENHLAQLARARADSPDYAPEIGALQALQALVWRMICDLCVPDHYLAMLQQLGSPYSDMEYAPVAGLYPHVAGIVADADTLCIACAVNAYGMQAVNYAIYGEGSPVPDREGNEIGPVLCDTEWEGIACCGNCGLKLDVTTI